jgi:hypothetical protein
VPAFKSGLPAPGQPARLASGAHGEHCRPSHRFVGSHLGEQAFRPHISASAAAGVGGLDDDTSSLPMV